MGLVDGLGGAHVAEFRRTVGGAGDQRHPAQMGLDHRGMELGRGRTAGGDHQWGVPGGPADPEGGESRRPLVQAYMHRHRRVGGQGHGEGGRPRSRAHHSVGHTAPDPLVDQGRGERSLDVRICGFTSMTGMSGVTGGRRYAHRSSP